MGSPSPTSLLPACTGGPGARLRRAFVLGWGVAQAPRTQCPTDPWAPAMVLPVFWRLLQTLGQPLLPAPWQAAWHCPRPVGTVAPDSLALLAHGQGGVVGVDLDPDDHGLQAAWWCRPGWMGRLAVDLEGLVTLVEQGPGAMEAACRGPWRDGFHVDHDALPFDPISRAWRDGWPQGARVVVLAEPGQGVALDGWFKRHPTQPLVALA